jgi:chlorobactene glucosyltransferase
LPLISLQFGVEFGRVVGGLLGGFFWAIGLVWIATLGYNLVCIKLAPCVPRNRKIEFERSVLKFQTGKAPLVSVLVPARNEAHRVLSDSILSMLSQDYPNFEVIAVDDRSTDGTSDILKKMASTDARLKVITGEVLPEGWLGKPFALHQAKQSSRGEWLLATDADVIFKSDAISHAISVAVREGCDALSLVPAISTRGFWMNSVMPVAGWLILLLFPYWKVNNRRSAVALGAGGFFLIRTGALDVAGGYEAIRSEVIDDAATARLLKQAGLRLKLSAGDSILATPMYSGLRELFEGFGKNVFAGSGASVMKALFFSALNLCFTLAPPVSFAFGLAWLLRAGPAGLTIPWAPLAAYLAMVAAFIPVYRRASVPVQYAFLSFLGHLVLIAILLSSTWRIVTGRGVTWKSRNLYAGGS